MRASEAFRVNFLIAGVQRAGTATIYQLLRQHPQIGMSSRKEVHFFDDEVHADWSKPDWDRYHSFFKSRESNETYGEATPIYIFWPRALQRIRTYNPDVKLILLFRDPISRTFSGWCHQRRQKRETLTFAEAIREGRRRMSSPTDFASRHFSYVERGLYAKQLSCALDLFPRANILTIESTELALRPHALVGRISDFLNIGTCPHDIRPLHVNRRADIDAREGPSADDVKFLVDIFASDVEQFASVVDFPIDHWPTVGLIRGSACAQQVAADLCAPGFARETLDTGERTSLPLD